MWSKAIYKAVIEEEPFVIDLFRDYSRTHCLGENYFLKGYLGIDNWANRPIEEFNGFMRQKFHAIKVIGIDVLSENEMQISYHINTRLEKASYEIHPRYLIGRYGEEGILFKPIAFDVYLHKEFKI